MSMSNAGALHRLTTTSVRRGARPWWFAGALLVVTSSAVSLALLPAMAQAQPHRTGSPGAASALSGWTSAPRTAVAVYSAHFSASKVSSIIGSKVALMEAKVEVTTSECIYIGTFEVIISRAPGIPAADLATVAKAEARIKSQSPKGVKFTFTSLPALGPTAFSWSYKLNGGQLVGVADNKGTTGFGTMLGGIPKLVGAPKGRVTALESLIKLDMAA